jgi:chromosome partitioning protein
MILAVAQSKGGVSKSTIVMNLMFYLSKYTPTLVDTDVQQSTYHLNIIREKTKKPFKAISITDIKQLEKIHRESSTENLFIVDTIGADTNLTRAVLLIADLIISPTTDKTIDVMGLINFQKVLQELSNKSNNTLKSHVIISNVLPNIKRFDELRDFIISTHHFNLFHSIIRQRSDVANAVGKGLAIGEYASGSKGDNEFKLFALEVEKLILNII